MKNLPTAEQEEIRIQIENNARMWRNLLICEVLAILLFWIQLIFVVVRGLA